MSRPSLAAFAILVLAAAPPGHAANTNALVAARGARLRLEIVAPGLNRAAAPTLRIFYRDPRTVVRAAAAPRFALDRWVIKAPVPKTTTDASFAVTLPAGSGGGQVWLGRYRVIPSRDRVPLLVDSPDGTFRARVPPEMAGTARLFVIGNAYVPTGAIPGGYALVSEAWRFGIGRLARSQQAVDVPLEYLAPMTDDGPLDPRLAGKPVVIFTDLGGTWHAVPTTFNPAVGVGGIQGRFDATYVAAVPVP